MIRRHVDTAPRRRRHPRRPSPGRSFRPEPLEDRTLLDSAGPRILGHTPTEVRNASLDHLDVIFSEPIDPATFTTADVSLAGPDGVIGVESVTALAPDQYRIAFAPTTARGVYSAIVGPDIRDPAGHPMDQDQDGAQAEPSDDQYAARLVSIQADAIFTTATVITEADSQYDGQDIAIVGTTVTIDGPHSFRSVHLVGGAVLTHSANTATQTHKLDLDVSDEVIVDASSRIDVTGKGYLAGRTTGNTTVGGATGTAAGSHGGLNSSGATNRVYGDYRDPDDWGAGGASGPGGGLVRIFAATIELDGRVLADGASFPGPHCGAGGGVYVEATTLRGSGSISAQGGLGSGGGGRVAVYARDMSGFPSGGITAYGHVGPGASSGAGTLYLRDTDEPAGTLLIRNRDSGNPNYWGPTPLGLPGQAGFAIPDAVAIRGSSTRVMPEHPGQSLEFQADLTVEHGAWLNVEATGFVTSRLPVFRSGATLNVAGDWSINQPLDVVNADVIVDGVLTSSVPQVIPGGMLQTERLFAPSLSLIQEAVLTSFPSALSEMRKLELEITGSVLIDATSRIDVSRKGYYPGRTTGNTSTVTTTGLSGGSHGGLGGGPRPGSVYDDYADPEDWGSGGGTGGESSEKSGAGRGGGLVRIVAQTMQLDGQILADAQGGFLAGGAGGGIYLAVSTLGGQGSIRAAGGQGFGGGTGGGGGGRIAVYAENLGTFSLNAITAPGGGIANGAIAPGDAGTVHIVQGRPHTHVRSHAPYGRATNSVDHGNGHLTQAIEMITLRFNAEIDLATFDPSSLEITGQMGRVVPTGITDLGDHTYRIDLPFSLTEDGSYHFRLPSTLRDAEGFPLDQDADGNPGEPLDDVYSFTLVVDTVGPRVTQHTPAGDVAGTIGSVDIWFSEAIEAVTFTTADVAITRPGGQAIAASRIDNVGLNRFRISFPAQTLVGNYQVKIGPGMTDRAGNLLDQDRDGVFGETESDVYTASFHLVQVDLGLSNLVVSPATLLAGEVATISWTGRNRTGAQLVGDWIDAVYLSKDATWDIDDTRLALVPHTGGLAEGQSYSSSATVVIPGTLPGDYHILVRADVANQEREDDEADNLVASAALPLVVTTLPADGTPSHGTLTPALPLAYFAVTVGPDDALGINLDGQATSGANELYVAFGRIPTSQDNDARALRDETRTDNQDQRLAVTAPPTGGTFYVLVRGAEIDGSTPYDLRPTAGPVIVTGITPTRGSNRLQTEFGTPIRTIATLSGAGFDETTEIEFVAPDGTVFVPAATTIISASTMTLTLDLPSWPAGLFDLRVSEGATTVTLQAAFRVVEEGLPQLETNLIIPSTLGFNIPIRQTIWIEYRNTGDAPMPAPLLQLKGSHDVRITADPALAIPFRGFDGAPEGVTDTVELIGLGSSATPWLLQPGESVRIPVYYIGMGRNHGYPRITFDLGVLTSEDLRLIDWRDQESLIRPEGIGDNLWAVQFVALQSLIGSKWGDYVSAIGHTFSASLRSGTDDVDPGQAPLDISRLWRRLLDESIKISSILPDWLTRYFVDYPNKHSTIQVGSPPAPDALGEQWLLYHKAVTKHTDAWRIHQVVLQHQSAYRYGVPGYYGEAFATNAKLIADAAFLLAKLSPNPAMEELAEVYGFWQDLLQTIRLTDDLKSKTKGWGEAFASHGNLSELISSAGNVRSVANTLNNFAPSLSTTPLADTNDLPSRFVSRA